MSRLLAVLGIVLALPSVARADPQTLAKRIDALLAQEHKVHKVQAAPPADDAEFLRRAHLDLTGRIPKVSDVRTFLADKEPDKRSRLIAALLDDPRHALHFAHVWRALLLPETAASGQARTFQPGFEAWLRQRFRANVAYDKWVRELLTVPIATDAQAAEVVFRDFENPNALAFFAVKDARPENLASATTRLFLGVQLECAQCHDHPFAKWSRKQFWNQAAFFAGIERQGTSVFAPLVEVVDRREVTLPNNVSKAPALLLDGTKPNLQPGISSRVALAEWITAADNPYFARATVNRVWGQLFGVGLVDPVDNFHDENQPSHPELLDELARKFAEAQFDLNYLITAICLTEAYQRTSARTHPSQDDSRLYGRMPVKGLTGEQFYDSLALATLYREPVPGKGKGKGKGAPGGSPRDLFLIQFAQSGPLSQPETSIQQALTLMNGKFVTDATSLRTSPMLQAVVETPSLKTAERIEILYLATLSRLPTAGERDRLAQYVAAVDPSREPERLADIFWVLLNSAEFRFNH